MENQRKTVAGKSSTALTPSQTKSGKVLHNFKFPADLRWGRSTSSTNFLRGRRQGESPSSSCSPQKQRPMPPFSGSPPRSVLLKNLLGQNPIAGSATSSKSSSRYPSPATVSDKESNVIDVLRSGLRVNRNKGESEERETLENEKLKFSMTLPSPDKMVDQFKKGLIVSDKQGREEKKVKKVNIHKKKSERPKVEGVPKPRIYEGKELVKDNLEVPCTKREEPLPKEDLIHKNLPKEDEESLSKIDDKVLQKEFLSNHHQGEDEDPQVITGESGDSERVPWSLRPRKPNQKPKVPKPFEAGGLSSEPRGKSVAEKKNKMPEEIGSGNADRKKGKGKVKKGKDKREKGKDKGRGEKANTTPIAPNFSLTLTPEEIAEDLFAMTGRKPTRKLKKREKSVQDTLDQLFPGLHLQDITPNDYKTSDTTRKGD